MTPEQLDHWFRYHAPTEETAPKYKAIREAEERCWKSISQGVFENIGVPAIYNLINAECKAFAQVVDELCPEGDDKAAAIRCIRLARNAFNEAVVLSRDVDNLVYQEIDNLWLFNLGKQELVKARWQANSAIACGGI